MYCMRTGRNGVRNAASEAAVYAVQTPRSVEQGIPREVGLARPKGGKLGVIYITTLFHYSEKFIAIN